MKVLENIPEMINHTIEVKEMKDQIEMSTQKPLVDKMILADKENQV